MCGIAGIISRNPNEVSLDRLQRMTDSIVHRGPDGEGHWIDDEGNVGMGHRRLSIIDLSLQAGQPMHYLNRYTIVFNGEIYNYIEIKQTLLKQGYSFHTQSDTEVLMALYDCHREKCLDHLDGMFAFAIYDAQEKTMFCARDRFGEKPFHYARTEGLHFIFGSEMKELWAAGFKKSVNQRMLFNYLVSDFLQNPEQASETFFEDIFRLEPAHYLLVNVRTLHIEKRKYWDLDLSQTNHISLEEASEQFRQLFTTSVKRRLRSDVPVGSSLSGGLDSSAVVCTIDLLNAQQTIHQRTFSAQFPGYEKDERYFQELVIGKTQAEAHYTFPNAQRMLSELDAVFYHQEEPFISSSILAQYEVFKLAKQSNTTVLLDGQGADEVLAGYHPYYMYYFLELEKDKDTLAYELAAYRELHSGNTINGLYQKDVKYALRKNLPFAFDVLKRIKHATANNRKGLSRDFYNEYKRELFSDKSQHHSLNQALYASLLKGPMQDLLRFADRNSMAHSVEVRLPFLSHELVEFVFSLPAVYKIHDGWTKYIMRHALKDVLPSQITWRTDKIGYEPPQKKWMEDKDVKERIHHVKSLLVQQGILDKQEVHTPVHAVDANAKGLNDWNCWMAGKLIA